MILGDESLSGPGVGAERVQSERLLLQRLIELHFCRDTSLVSLSHDVMIESRDGVWHISRIIRSLVPRTFLISLFYFNGRSLSLKKFLILVFGMLLKGNALAIQGRKIHLR